MRRSLLIALAAPLLGLAAFAGSAAAQTWGRYDGSYSSDSARYDGGWRDGRGYDGYRRDSNAVPSDFDWRAQLDRPGDYRCDQFWDANRDDCGAGWRDQRRRVSPQARRDYRALAGHRYDDGSGYGRVYDRYGGYGHRRRGYGSSYGYGYGHGQGGTTYEGAYGRPDIVFPDGGRGYAGRSDWCRARYRSYDPATGYYRAYSGRLVWCG